MGKVIHISDELHVRIRDHCENKGIRPAAWASEVLVLELDLENVKEHRRQCPPAKVEKKPIPKPEVRRDGENPWESTPFWDREEQEPEKQLEEDGAQPSGVFRGKRVGVDGASNEVRGTSQEGSEREGTSPTQPPQESGELDSKSASQQGEPNSFG